MPFNPPNSFQSAFVDFWNLTAAFKNNGLTPDQYMHAAKQAYDTFNAILSMTFWSIMNEVREDIPEEVFDKWMRRIADEQYGFDNASPEQRFQHMVELIENTMLQINPDHIGEMYGNG